MNKRDALGVLLMIRDGERVERDLLDELIAAVGEAVWPKHQTSGAARTAAWRARRASQTPSQAPSQRASQPPSPNPSQQASQPPLGFPAPLPDPQKSSVISEIKSPDPQKPSPATSQKPAPSNASQNGRHGDNVTRVRHAEIESLFSEARKAVTGATYRLQHSDYDSTCKVVEWSQAEHAANPHAAISRSIAGFMRGAKGYNGEPPTYSYAAWSKDPARWYAAGGEKPPVDREERVRQLKLLIAEAERESEMCDAGVRDKWLTRVAERRAELERLLSGAA